MGSVRLLSLAAGTVLDLAPADAVDAAAAAGFRAVGLWFDPETWTDATTRAVAARLGATGITALDIEPVILGRGSDAGERLVAAAAELGVANILVASGPASLRDVVDRLGALAECAAGVVGLTLALEFLPIFTVATLAEAMAVVDEVAAPNVGVLIDTLHLARSGGSPADVLAYEPGRLPYLQLADAPATGPTTVTDLRDEALHGRLLPGSGELPLRELLAAVPGVPVSVELRSRALMERYRDPVERAVAVRIACEALGFTTGS